MDGKWYEVVYREASLFLYDKTGMGVSEDIDIEPPKAKPKNMRDAYRCLMNAMLSVKRFRAAAGNAETLEQALCGFDPKRVQVKYQYDWESLRQVMTNGNIDIDTHDDLGILCKGAVDGAHLLSYLGSVKVTRMFVECFLINEMTLAALPLLLQKEVYGMTYGTACLFLQSLGYTQFVCPHPRVKILLQDMDMVETRENYESLKTLTLMAKANNTSATEVHQVLMIIASEKARDKNFKGQLRKPFIDYIIPVLGELTT